MRNISFVLFVLAASVVKGAPLPQYGESTTDDTLGLGDYSTEDISSLGDYTTDDTLVLGDYTSDGSINLGDYTTDGTLTGDYSTDAMDYVQGLGQDIRNQDGDYYTYDPSSDLPDMTTWTQAERTGYLSNRVESSHDMTMNILNNWSSSSSSVFI